MVFKVFKETNDYESIFRPYKPGFKISGEALTSIVNKFSRFFGFKIETK